MTACIPTGSFTLSKRPAAFASGIWDSASVSEGPMLRTVSGANYLDFICALGALVVGNHPRIVEAVCRQMRDGAIYSLPHRLERVIAERLVSVIPCAEQVKVVKTGSESTSAAIRIARAFHKGRTSLVLGLKGHYHGWHDWWAVTAPKHPGVPDYMYDGVRAMRTVQGLLDMGEDDEWHGSADVAAFIVEPERVEQEMPGGLAKLRQVATDNGIVLIFDEMLSGGRLALAGAQQYYNVTPDLATYGKAFGGGLPFAFVCGKADLMQHAWPASGTFSGDALALAAAEAMLDVYSSEPVIDMLWSHGEYMQRALQKFPFLTIHGHQPRFWFTFPPEVDRRMAMSVFTQQCAKRGVLAHQAVMFMSAALSVVEIQHAARAMEDAMDVVAAGIEDGDLASRLDGVTYEDSVR